jgi:3-oxoacyl-[acyl-carrier protein] reductase
LPSGRPERTFEANKLEEAPIPDFTSEAVEFSLRRERTSGSMLAERPEPHALDKREMRGNTALITGGASGLGRAAALEFARRGVNVAFNYIELKGRDIAAQALLTETTLRGYGIEVFSECCDVRERDVVEAFVARASEAIGGPHYLVNNAGIHADGALWRLSDEAWRDVMETNVTGAFNCIRAVIPIFRRQRYGKIVNIVSQQVYRPGFGVSNYATSKSALVGLTKSAAVELGPYNVNVNGVAPGFVRTELVAALPPDLLEEARQRTVMGRLADPEDVTPLIVFLCSDDARHITGQVILVDGGVTLA